MLHLLALEKEQKCSYTVIENVFYDLDRLCS
jgi:hypothetical protein